MTSQLTFENLKKLIAKKEELQLSVEYLIHLKNYPKAMAVLSRDTLQALSDEAQDGWVSMSSVWSIFDTHQADFSPDSMTDAISLLQDKLKRITFVFTELCDGRRRFDSDLLD